MQPLKRLWYVALPAFVGVVAAVALSAISAAAAPVRYVALGDSYSSGVGTRTYDPASGACQRSPLAYPELVSHRLGWNLRFVACGGATTASMPPSQLPALNRGTNVVTLSVGGNDAGFGTVMENCIFLPPARLANHCSAEIAKANSFIESQLPELLDNLYKAIRLEAPNAKVAVVGYPRLFIPSGFPGCKLVLSGDQAKINHTGDLIDGVIGARAAAHRFIFVDPRQAFTGHAVCSKDEWLNGPSNPTSESFHPNAKGQAAYAGLVESALSAPHHG